MLTYSEKLERRKGIGGSEIAAIMGLSDFAGPFDVYLSKTEGWEQPPSPALERGTFLEDGLARWYAHRTGASIGGVSAVAHPEQPVFRCTPDRLARQKTGELLDLSIKAPYRTDPEEWGEPGTDLVPIPYVLQVQWELAILEALHRCDTSEAHLAAMVEGDLRIYIIPRDMEMQGHLQEAALRFWRDYVEPRRPPPLDASETCTTWLKRRFKEMRRPLREASPAEDAIALELREAEARAKAAEAPLLLARNRIREAIGDGEGILGAFGKVTWRADKNGRRNLRTNWRK